MVEEYKTNSIAILMATYNGEKFIRDQIDSLLGQTYKKWELFIHDDGSADNTMEIVYDYVKKYPEKIHIVEGPGTGGAKNNFFYLMRKVDAPYVMFCDQDDYWLPFKIAHTYRRMVEIEKRYNDKPALVFADLKVADEKLNVIDERMSKSQKLYPYKTKLKDLMIQNIVTGCTMMLNKSCVKKSLEVCNEDRVIMHDWWISLVAAYFGVISFLNEAVILYRQHGGNTVGAIHIMDIRYLTGKFFKKQEIKKALRLTRIQAGEFVMVYGLPGSSVISKYSRIGRCRKIKRLLFLINNRIWKCGLMRNVGLIVWG